MHGTRSNKINDMLAISQTKLGGSFTHQQCTGFNIDRNDSTNHTGRIVVL